MSTVNNSASELTPPELRRIKQSIAGIMLVLALLIAARLWCLEGLLFPISIFGASMADTLVGPHYRVSCSDCGHEFRCDATATPQEVECPNCGHAHTKVKSEDLKLGEQVLIDHWVYLLSRPQRGDVVAFTHRDDDAPRVVKRIVGLPGETIAIRRGDVIVDGKPLTKNLKQLRDQALLVHDSAQLPKAEGLPKRWEAEAKDSYWREREGSYFYRAHTPGKESNSRREVGPQTKFDWLSFRYFRRSDAPDRAVRISPVLDFDAFNQAGNRNLNYVPDLLLTCRASIARYGCLIFAAVDGDDRLEVHLCHDEHKLKVYQNGQLLAVELLPHRNHDEPIDIQFALCDQRVLFGMDGRQVLAQPYERLNLSAAQADPQLQIGAAGARIRISHAKVYRDIYYLEPLSTDGPWHADEPIPANHYLVLGDNPPVSVDSRQWPHAEVPLAAIRGRVIRPWWTP